MSYDALFSPIKIRGLELKNRVVMPGMCTKMTRDKDFIDDNMIQYHVARAKGGCGLNTFEIASVCPEPQAFMYMGLHKDEHIEQFKRLTDAVHEAGGKISLQLWHGGFTPQLFFDETNVLETPDTLSVERIQEIVKQFGEAAARAVEAGFDAIEFHAAHSYLPHEFASPGMNKRTDEYGGSPENRFRFIWDTVEEIRKNMPDTMPLFMRFGCMDENMEQVMTEQEIVDLLNGAADRGVDVADLSRGNGISFATVYEVPPYNLPHGFNIENIYNIKKQIKIPVCGVGRIVDPAMANKAIEEGKFDLVAIGRAQLADPEWCNKAKAGEVDKIRRCISCNQGCYDAVIDNDMPHITCMRNPMLGLEYKGVSKAETPKKVMVVGGGPGGMMAARFLKLRGHEPVIFEATDKLGGNFRFAGEAPNKETFKAAVEWDEKELKRTGVEIRYNTKVTPEVIEEFKPDEVILAIGANNLIPPIPGVDGENVVSPQKVLSGEIEPKGTFAVVGCGSVGNEVAQYLAARGAKVVPFEIRGMGNGLAMMRRMFQGPEFKYLGIKGFAGTTVTAIEPGKVHYVTVDRKTKEATEGTLECDKVVICTGAVSRPTDDLKKKCEELGIPVQVIGDAAKVGDALKAGGAGYRAAMAI